MSEITFAGQTASLLIAAVMGASLCLLYDLFRILRMISPPGKISAFIEDVLWFAAAAAATYMLCLARCKGEVRSYIIIGEILGFILFRMTASRVIMLAARPSVRAVKRLFRRIKGLIIRIFKPIVIKLTEKIKKIASQIEKKKKKHLRPRISLLYNRKKKNILNSDTE